jgi:hypothetical protein
MNIKNEAAYAEFILKNAGGDRIIANGDMLTEAMEDGYLYDEFVLDQFADLGSRSSYCLAGSEYSLGYSLQSDAEQLFIDNLDLQPKMREIAKGFLWTLKG